LEKLGIFSLFALLSGSGYIGCFFWGELSPQDVKE
jgi:hypothetical protein